MPIYRTGNLGSDTPPKNNDSGAGQRKRLTSHVPSISVASALSCGRFAQKLPAECPSPWPNPGAFSPLVQPFRQAEGGTGGTGAPALFGNLILDVDKQTHMGLIAQPNQAMLGGVLDSGLERHRFVITKTETVSWAVTGKGVTANKRRKRSFNMKSKAILSTVVFSLVTALFALPSVAATVSTIKVSANKQISLNRAMSDEDPNRDPNWDWTDDRPYDLYVKSDIGVTKHPNIPLPYFSNEGPASELNIPGDWDIRREEGWVLLYRDFGVPEHGATMPLFILYNRFRGIVRFFYFNTLESESHTFSIVHLSQKFPSVAAALFTFDGRDAYLNNFDKEQALVAIGKIGRFQWSYADFVILGFDNQTNRLTNSTLMFEVKAIDESQLKLSGEITLNQILKDGGITASAKNGKVDVVGGFMNARKTYKSINGVKNDLSEKVKNNPNAWYADIVTGLLDSPIGKFAPGIGAVASLIKSFIGGGKDKRVTPMNFEGRIEVTGEITTPAFLYSLDLRLPGSPHPDPNDSAITLYDKPLGVFNLQAEPVAWVTFRTCGLYCGIVGTDIHSLKEPILGVVNDLSDVADVKIEAGYAFRNRETVYTSLADFSTVRGSISSEPFPEIALKVTIEPHAADEPPIVIVKTYRAGQAALRVPFVSNVHVPPIMNNAVATLFPAPYGPGVALGWIPTIIPKSAYYEIQFYEHDGTTWPQFQLYTARRDISHGGWINHHGNLACGAAFTRCLKSNQRYTYRLRVLDSAGTPVSEWSNMMSATSMDWAGLAPPQQPPTITAPAFETVFPKNTLTFTVKASDLNGDSLQILVDGLPGGASLAPTSGTGSVMATFRWHPGPADVGDYRITFTARDGRGATSAPRVTTIMVCDSLKNCLL